MLRTSASMTRQRAVGVAAALALSAAGVVAAAPAIAAPEPAQEVEVTSASLQWGVKESFRNYITGPIADGQIALQGSTTQTEDGTFEWSNGTGTATTDGSSVDVSFGADNGVHFTGHDYGEGAILDQAFTNPHVVITSGSAELRADVHGREFVDTTTLGDWYTLEDATVATLDLDQAQQSGTTLTWTNAPATLTDEGAQAFGGFYEPGAALDPITLTVTTAEAIDPPKPGNGNNGGGNGQDKDGDPTVSIVGGTSVDQGGELVARGSGFAAGTEVTATVYSEPVVIGSQTVGGDGGVEFTWTVPSDFPAGEHTLELATGGTTAEVEFTVNEVNSNLAGLGGNLQTESTDGTITCTTEYVEGTDGTPSLSWGVRSSFVSYVEGGIANGEISTANGASRSGSGFSWGSGSGSLDESGQGTLSFPGSVHFTGHDGILQTTLSNPRVEVTDASSGVLIVDVQSQDMEGNDLSASGVTFANLSFSSWAQDGGTAQATLTGAGAEAFAGFYSAGESLDSLTVSVSGATEGQTVEVCYDADGNRVNPDGTPYTGGALASTGMDDAGISGLIGLAAALGLLGAVLVASRARRTIHS